MEFLTDEYGCKYLKELPENAREASLDDFHVNGMKKLGMLFLILGIHWPVYQVYKVKDSLTAKFLDPFIREHRVFILNQQ